MTTAPPAEHQRRPPRCRRRAPPRDGATRNASVTHGAAAASRAALTVQPCRASSSPRVRASSRRNADSVRSSRPRSVPPTSRASRSDSTMRSATGSASRSFSASSAVAEPAGRPVVGGERARTPARTAAGPRSPSWASASGSEQPGPHGRREVVDDVGPHGAQRGPATRRGPPQPAPRAAQRRSEPERDADDRRAAHRQASASRTPTPHDRRVRHQTRRRDPADARLDDQRASTRSAAGARTAPARGVAR